MSSKKSLEELTSDVTWRLRPYHPWWIEGKIPNPDRDHTTRLIMGLKTPSPTAEAWKHKQHVDSIKHFTKILETAINKNFDDCESLQIAIVPSSQKEAYSKGLTEIVSNIQVKPKLIVSNDFLVRTKSVSKSHTGGSRSIDKHLSSIEVREVPDKHIPVLILDDVTTSGYTLRACRRLLSQAGVKHIIMLAFGKTVH